jgi:thiosulfate/3-mercaptopyruvate sulfurtransferase
MDPLVSVEDLSAMLGTGAVVCDVRWYLTDPARGRREYETAHIPGAVFIDLHSELAGGPGGGRHPLPTVDDFTALLGRRGIGPHSTVIAHDDAGGAIASRLWWMLRSIGHERVAVLDGGYSAWVRAGLAVTSDPASPPSVSYPEIDGWTGVVSADEVVAAIERGGVVIDARASERYDGEIEPIDPRAGHVPGALNMPHLDNLSVDGTHLSPDELAERFGAIGAEPIVYCGSGVTACHDLLAMAVAGIADARLYPGSWSEWSSDPDRPVETSTPP